ncbi:protein of unknown function (plasmid) [Streptantibioticus cattleyicolor NRRL 8057 = DSM 46488]|nr:protein of unknown function [Streptantibioticus cattleyicolor NRRL 8057 = DSM 46488]
MLPRGAEEPGQRAGQVRHEEERGGVHMAAVGDQCGRHVLRPGGQQAARRGEDGPVGTAGHDGGQRCRQRRVDGERADVDAAFDEAFPDERAGGVVTDPADERHPQPEPGGTAGHDGGRSAEQQTAGVDELFPLPEGEFTGQRADDDIRVDVAYHEEVEGWGHGVFSHGGIGRTAVSDGKAVSDRAAVPGGPATP